MHHHHHNLDWTSCTLCRSNHQSVQVLRRAEQRKIEWPKPKQYSERPVQDPVVYTNIDDAFTSVLQFMSTTTRQCKRFYNSCGAERQRSRDNHHCGRYHTEHFIRAHHHNPTAEDVHMVVHPGTYAVTAGEWGRARQQTHMVHVEPGQSVNLDFCM